MSVSVVDIGTCDCVYILPEPSDSMSPELREGDFVLVWKPVVGARLFNLNKSLNLEQAEIYRMPGFRKFRTSVCTINSYFYC